MENRSSSIVLFDGVCNLCHHSVQFILPRDKRKKFLFASLQSPIGQSLLQSYKIPLDTQSIVLIEDNRFYTKSEAVLRISKDLQGIWKWFYILMIIPRPLRDAAYAWVAANRYRWFGKEQQCFIPTKEIQSRFLDSSDETVD